MAKRSRAPSDSRGANKAKRAGVATKPTPSALAILSSWPAKRARGARRRRRYVPRWADLTCGPAGVIAEHALANDMSDHLSFRAVCREWRRGAVDAAPRPRGCLDRRFHPRRWIMLREAAPPGPGRHRRRFLNVSTGECVQTELPELDGHRLLGATTEGLLVLLDKSTFVVRVLNPITWQLAELPSLDPLLPPKTRGKISEYGLTYGFKVTGVGLAGDSTVALCVYDPMMLVVAKPGDDGWTPVEVKGGDGRWLFSAISFHGRFYCVNSEAVMVLEAATADKPPRLVVASKLAFGVSGIGRDTVHLVESDGRLLLLHRKFTSREEYNPQKKLSTEWWIRKYKVNVVDLAKKRTVAAADLGGRAVFLGKTRALSVSPLVFPSIRANMVYPAADIWERREQGVSSYCLLSGAVGRCKVRLSRRMSYHDEEFDGGWERPCGIGDYLSWYVSGRSYAIEEI